MEKLIIFGAGGFGREVKFLIEEINNHKPTYHLVGFYDNFLDKGSSVNGINVLGNIEDLSLLKEPISVVIALGDPIFKLKYYDKIKNNRNLFFPTIVHPSVNYDKSSVLIGNGSIICANSILTVNISLGLFTTINLMSSIGHDTKIGDFCSFMPSVNISGEVRIMDQVFIGTGSKIINKVTIGENTVIGAGSVVINDIPSNCTAVGLPARVVKIK